MASAEDTAERMIAVGTPPGLTAEQRQGFEAYVEGLAGEGETANADVLALEVEEEDRPAGEAFVQLVGETCA